jgi:hypothetical protein
VRAGRLGTWCVQLLHFSRGREVDYARPWNACNGSIPTVKWPVRQMLVIFDLAAYMTLDPHNLLAMTGLAAVLQERVTSSPVRTRQPTSRVRTN